MVASVRRRYYLTMKGTNTLLKLGIGNVAFITFAAMLGIMAVLSLAKILGGKSIPLVSTTAQWVDTAWQKAA